MHNALFVQKLRMPENLNCQMNHFNRQNISRLIKRLEFYKSRRLNCYANQQFLRHLSLSNFRLCQCHKMLLMSKLIFLRLIKIKFMASGMENNQKKILLLTHINLIREHYSTCRSKNGILFCNMVIHFVIQVNCL